MLEKVHHVRLENPSSLRNNLEETPPTNLMKRCSNEVYQAAELLSRLVMNVSYRLTVAQEMMLHIKLPDSNGDDGFQNNSDQMTKLKLKKKCRCNYCDWQLGPKDSQGVLYYRKLWRYRTRYSQVQDKWAANKREYRSIYKIYMPKEIKDSHPNKTL